MKHIPIRTIFSIAAFFCCALAKAQLPPIKVGLIAPFSGPFASEADMDRAVKTFQQMHGDSVAGRKVIILRKDAPGPAPDVARRLAQEMVVRDKVDFLSGFIFTPTAIAAGQISTEAKVPMVIMNAATSGILSKIPYAVRASFTLAQVTAPLARWAAKNGIKKVYTLVVDYAPGVDAETTFTREFTAAGGTISGSIRSPLSNLDFSPFARRIKDSQPDAVFVFLPSADLPKSFLAAFRESGMDKAGIKLLAEGSMFTPEVLKTLGDEALGIISSHHYSDDHPSAMNQAFVKAFGQANDGQRPSYIAAGAYDAMKMIYSAVDQQGGKIDPQKTVDLMSSMTFESPRGPIQMDPATRDIVQNVYIRRIERKGSKLVNVEFETISAVKESGTK